MQIGRKSLSKDSHPTRYRQWRHHSGAQEEGLFPCKVQIWGNKVSLKTECLTNKPNAGMSQRIDHFLRNRSHMLKQFGDRFLGEEIAVHNMWIWMVKQEICDEMRGGQCSSQSSKRVRMRSPWKDKACYWASSSNNCKIKSSMSWMLITMTSSICIFCYVS